MGQGPWCTSSGDRFLYNAKGPCSSGEGCLDLWVCLQALMSTWQSDEGACNAVHICGLLQLRCRICYCVNRHSALTEQADMHVWRQGDLHCCQTGT